MKTPKNEPEKRTVYVVFHGLISLVERKDKTYCAYILSVGAVHRYLWGNWLRETEIPAGFSGRFRVGGGPGTREGKLDPNERPTINLSKCKVDEQNEAIYGRIILPQPNTIHYANSGPITLKNSGKDQLRSKAVAKNAGTTVFAYQVNNFDDCYLMDDRRVIKWEAEPQTSNYNHHVAALHLYSNPANDPTATHSVDEFHLSASTLGASGLRLACRGKDTSSDWKPDGLCTEELLSLSRRDSILAGVTDILRKQVRARALGGGGCESCCSGSDGSC